MSRARPLNPKPIFDEELVLEAFRKNKIKESNAAKLWRYLIQQPEKTIDEIPDFPKAARKLIDDEFVITTSKVISRTDAKDGSTTKLLIELQDGQRVESVIMRYGEVELDCFPEEEERRKRRRREGNGEDGEEILEFRSNKRATLCVSSQVGCAMGCTFCATGTMGLLSNLAAGEIIEQLYHANKIEKIRNIVFMGMGEPLDNYNAVMAAVRAMVDTGRFGLAPSRISVSTVGVVPRIHSLIKDAPNIGLALSLHAPNQTLRQQIVPTAKAWHVDRILSACDAFIDHQNGLIKSTNRRRHILVEYVLIRDVNDSQETAHELGQLLKGRHVLLNVIPYNPTSVPHDYKTPNREDSRRFVETVREYGVHTLLRQTLGADAASACGQLVIDNGGQKTSGQCGDDKGTGNGVADLEDLLQNTGAGKNGVKVSIKYRKKAPSLATPTGVERNPLDTLQSGTAALTKRRSRLKVATLCALCILFAVVLGRVVLRSLGLATV
ncbi:23S rRNA methyltransferase [Spizellomyces punctatus DAOM BR117]|uniref:23S rRNA methyltransferase n=1 Tax=Spizellomyces punctatus (strain DAOM BR117) TaxID=645134 RepID=A0A0L0HT40_SPIPD|nr:23S rRNA methyltransferase [Spizellomyces punctatus DAOM BR117]KND04516.1 23S rRNA methyltransferase [Spizellomyces punctatus DAOM BR117]|eukprot:XP_016612555.1 23S rRNA methyltransferase [Spizellomyces punctatus DAOM BR117]